MNWGMVFLIEKPYENSLVVEFGLRHIYHVVNKNGMMYSIKAFGSENIFRI